MKEERKRKNQMPVQMFIDLVVKTTLDLSPTKAIQRLNLKREKKTTTLTYITTWFSIFHLSWEPQPTNSYFTLKNICLKGKSICIMLIMTQKKWRNTKHTHILILLTVCCHKWKWSELWKCQCSKFAPCKWYEFFPFHRCVNER